MKLQKFVAVASIVCGTQLAVAQPAPPPDPNAPDPNTQPDPNAPQPGPIAGDPNQPPLGPPTATNLGLSRWPIEIIQRPLTLRQGLIRAQGDLGISQVTVMDTSATGIALTASGAYGVSDQLEIGAAYRITLKEFEAKGPLTAFLNYQLVDSQFKVAFTGAFTYDIPSEIGTLGLGLALQYNLTPQFAVYVPGNQVSVTAIVKDMAARPVTLALPLGIEFQASPNINIFAQTSFGTVNISNSASVFIGDIAPVQFGGFYSPTNEIDIGAALQFPDIKHAGDVYVVLITGRLFVAN